MISTKPFIMDNFGLLQEEKIVTVENIYSKLRTYPGGILGDGSYHYAKIKDEDESYEFGYNDPNTEVFNDNIPGQYKITFLPNSKIILKAERQ